MTINIHATVSGFSVPYFEYMYKNYNKMAESHKIVFYTYCLDDSSVRLLSGKSNTVRVPSSSGTDGHCIAIKFALENFKNTEPNSIDIIADTDTAMLVKGWDNITEKVLSDVGAFGSSFERIGGRCSGSGNVQMYKGQPSFTWFAASKKYDFSKMDTTPNKHVNLDITDKDLSSLYQLPVGFKLLRDTGWQIPSYLRDNNIPYKILDQEKPTDNAKILKTGDNYHEEYQIDGVPFMAHQRGSLSKQFRVHELSRKFYDTLDSYFAGLN
jgi:hypothetical protein